MSRLPRLRKAGDVKRDERDGSRAHGLVAKLRGYSFRGMVDSEIEVDRETIIALLNEARAETWDEAAEAASKAGAVEGGSELPTLAESFRRRARRLRRAK